MCDIYNRIENLCALKKISVTDLCRETGISRSTLTELKKGRTKTLSAKNANKLADYFSVSSDIFINNDNTIVVDIIPSPLFSKCAPDPPHPLEPNATLLSKEHIHLIPVFESVAAGFGAYADNRIVEYMPLYIVSDSEAENTIVVKVQGDSMYPKIENGDSIQVLRQDFAENGQVAVLLIDNEDAVVKQFFHDPDAKTVTLHSFNPEYKDREFKGIEIEQLRILGVVKKVIKEI